MNGSAEISGFCRACGHPRLIRNRAAQVVCTHPFCPDPWKTHRLLTSDVPRKVLPDASSIGKHGGHGGDSG